MDKIARNNLKKTLSEVISLTLQQNYINNNLGIVTEYNDLYKKGNK